MPPTPFCLRRHRPHGGHAIVRLICVQHIHHNGKPLLYLVFEYLNTDIKKSIDSHRKGPNPSPLPSSQIQSFLFQLCKGIAHCHGHGVLHRSINVTINHFLKGLLAPMLRLEMWYSRKDELFSQTTTPIMLPKSCSIISTTLYLLGPSASFQTATMLFSILPKLVFNPHKMFSWETYTEDLSILLMKAPYSLQQVCWGKLIS